MATTLNRFGLLITVFFFLGGVLFLIGPFFGLSLGSRVAGLGWFGIAGFVLYRQRRGSTAAARAERIAASGLRGVATVVSAAVESSSGAVSKLSLRLDLELPGTEPRQVDLVEEVMLFAAHAIKPGLKLPVVVDPDHPQDLVLVW